MLVQVLKWSHRAQPSASGLQTGLVDIQTALLSGRQHSHGRKRAEEMGLREMVRPAQGLFLPLGGRYNVEHEPGPRGQVGLPDT